MEARNGFTHNEAWPFINASVQSRARSNAQIQLSCLRTSIPSPVPQVARHDMVFILSPFVLLWRQCGNKELRAHKTENVFWQPRAIALPAPEEVHPAISPQGHATAGLQSWSTLGSLPLPPPRPSLRSSPGLLEMSGHITSASPSSRIPSANQCPTSGLSSSALCSPSLLLHLLRSKFEV